MWCRKSLLRKCSVILFVMFGWLEHCINHSFLSCVGSSGRSLLFNLICVLATFLSRNSMHVIGKFTHDCFVVHGMCGALSILVVTYLVSLWYMNLSFLGLFKASLNYSPIHLIYALHSEKAPSPNKSYGS